MESIVKRKYGTYIVSLLICMLVFASCGCSLANGDEITDQPRSLYAQTMGPQGKRPGKAPFGGPQLGMPRAMSTPPEVAHDYFDPAQVAENERSPFGVDAPFTKKGNPFDWNGEEGTDLLRKLGIAWIMPSATFGVSPLNITPTAGGRDFLRLDRYVLNAQAANVHVLFVVSPRELSSAPPPSPPGFPKDVDNYLQVVRAAIERYDGDGIDDMPGLRYPIKYWMVLNEPFFRRYWAGSAEDYCRLFIQTYRAVKEADPGAKVVLSSLINPHMEDTFSFAEQFFKCYKQALDRKEAPATIDAIDLHWISKQEADQAYPEYKRGLDWLMSQCQQIGLKIPEVICTEACVLTHDRDAVARDVVKRYLLARSLGISKIFWSSLVSADPKRDFFTAISLKTIPDDPALDVYRFMAKSVRTGACTLKQPQTGVFEIKVENGPKVWWRDIAGEIGQSITAKNARDIYGKSLTGRKITAGTSPIYSFD
ncbi:MAG: hypothetical protein RBS57_15565 [Desulforhabdus sp.]|jgi:hypothetical protein|nr:hypothetical protein [Desulforhabdus sp.]